MSSEWSLPNHAVGNQWTISALMEAAEEFVHQGSKKAVHSIIEPPHYPDIEPKFYIIPILHVQMGMVNKAFFIFTDWVDDYVENILQPELDAQHNVFVQQQLCKSQMEEKD